MGVDVAPVGPVADDTLLDVIRNWHDLGFWDVWSSPNAKTLNATAWGGRATSTSAGLLSTGTMTKSSRPRSIQGVDDGDRLPLLPRRQVAEGYFHHDAAPGSTLPAQDPVVRRPMGRHRPRPEFAQKQATKLAGVRCPIQRSSTWATPRHGCRPAIGSTRSDGTGRWPTSGSCPAKSPGSTTVTPSWCRPRFPQSMLIDRIDNDLRIAATGTSGGSSTSAVSFRNTDSGIQSASSTAPSTETWSWTQVGEEDTGAGGHVVEFNEPICITLITISFSAGVDLDTDVPIPVNDLPGTVQFRYYLNDVLAHLHRRPPNHATWRVFGNAMFPGRSRFSVIISSTGTNTLVDLAGVRATMKFDTAPGWFDPRERRGAEPLEGTARPVSSSTRMTCPTLLPCTLGVDWTITIDPSTRPEPPTGWTTMTVDLRSGPTEDFDLLATSRTIAGPLSQTIDTTGSDPDAAEIRLVVEASATALIPRPGAKVRGRVHVPAGPVRDRRGSR